LDEFGHCNHTFSPKQPKEQTLWHIVEMVAFLKWVWFQNLKILIHFDDGVFWVGFVGS